MLSAMKTLLSTIHSKYIHPSLALPCLAAFCDSDCGKIVILEFTQHEPKDTILETILIQKPDVVALSVYIWNRQLTLEIVDALHVAVPDLKIILGGPEVSYENSNLLQQHPGLTAIVQGEGELPVKELLSAWSKEMKPDNLNGLLLRDSTGIIHCGTEKRELDNLDLIPSPFGEERVDMSRGFVYYETSRGCPYNCSFCLSARDKRVRSFSMPRIKKDLLYLMERKVPKIKLVDRTFNYNAKRAIEIWQFIRQHNTRSHFHFEIGAHLLTEGCFQTLEEIPENWFQFEIGVQSTSAETLRKIDRSADLEIIEKNVRRLVQMGNIHLHLDLIAGLPGEDLNQFYSAVDRVMALAAGDLQVEAVKLLPGAPLRQQADALGICFDPHPPYRVLRTPWLSFTDLEKIQAVGKLLDLLHNSDRFPHFLASLQGHYQSMAKALDALQAFWKPKEILRHPQSLRALFDACFDFVCQKIPAHLQTEITEALAWDYACAERVVPGKIPPWIATDLTQEEMEQLKRVIREEQKKCKGRGIKLQYFAAVFHTLDGQPGRQVFVFLYRTATGRKMSVRTIHL